MINALNAIGVRKLLGAIALLGLLSGCGDSGDDAAGGAPAISQFRADAANYFIGEKAQLTAIFSDGAGRIEPGNVAVTSGQPITTTALDRPVEYTLTVTGSGKSVSRKLALNVTYRERMRTIAMPFARAEHATVSLNDGRVLVIGGDGTESTLPASLHVFNPATEQFANFGSLSTGRLAFGTAMLNNGNVLVVGGLRALSAAPQAEIINGQTGVATPTAHAPVHDRADPALTTLSDGRVLITGGRVAGDPDNTAEIYDPATGRFTAVPGAFTYRRFAHAAVRIDDRKILLYGGAAYPGMPVPGPELLDPVTGNATTLAAVEPNMRYHLSAITAQDGSVLLFGGEDEDSNPLASVIRFDPASSGLTRALDLATSRSFAGITRLTDGRLLIAGGLTGMYGTDVSDTSELVALPAQRRDGPAMNSPRFLHTVTRLYNGKVLVIGGLGENRLPLATVEIFE